MKSSYRRISLGVITFLLSQITACRSQDVARDFQNIATDLWGSTFTEDQAIKRNSKDTQALYNRGVVRRERGDRQGAIADFTAVIQIACKESQACQVDTVAAYCSRGREFERLGDKKKALEDYRKAVEISKQWENPTHELIQRDIERIQHSSL